MKLSSLSLMAASLATIMIASTSAAAAPALRPVEQNLFEHRDDVYIYSRGIPTHTHQMDHDEVVKSADHVIKYWENAVTEAEKAGKYTEAVSHRGNVSTLWALRKEHHIAAQTKDKTAAYEKIDEAKKTIDELTPWRTIRWRK